MAQLNRVIGLPGLCLYGIGVTLGAGIYALVGEIAGLAGLYAPWAFVLARQPISPMVSSDAG